MKENNLASNENRPDSRQSDNYIGFAKTIQERFNQLVQDDTPIFTMKVDGLFDIFLNNLSEDGRQHYNCNTCRRFVDNYGSLVVINNDGSIESVLWDEVPDFFNNSVKEMKKVILKSKTDSVFISKETTLGTPTTGEWGHMHVILPRDRAFKSRLKTAHQEMAEKKEDFKILVRALLEYPTEAVEQALTLLKTESLYRSEKCLGVAEWLKDIHTKLDGVKNNNTRNNIIWLAVGTAPVGFCHVKSSMIGTLLDDIVDGLSFDIVSRRFAEKMNPLKYQRPQSTPTSGNIAQAEKIVEKLGIKKSLDRRFARLDEIETIWNPKESNVNEENESESVFSHLKAKGEKEIKQMDLLKKTMTWKKFLDTLLPIAESIEYKVQYEKANYSGILTATNEDAPPILQWDSLEKRNPFSHYVYNGGSSPSNWNLSTGYVKVNAICYQPSMWYDENPHQGKSITFILEGAKDTRMKYGGNGNVLFPETLKSELREIRKTIEAYSKTATLGGYEDASVCGIRLQKDSNWNAEVKVKTSIGIQVVKLDRWD